MALLKQGLLTLEDAYAGVLLGSANAVVPKNSIVEIDYADLALYENQKYRMYDKEEQSAMVEDIRVNGVLSPAVVRPFEGGYQILAGRNRTKCAQLAGLSKMPCIIKENCSDAMAKLIVNSSNLNQRTELSIKEKAYGYRDQKEALEELGSSRKTVAEVASQANENIKTIHRYIRLTFLTDPLLDFVSDGKLSFVVGVDLSYFQYKENMERLSGYLSKHPKQKITGDQAKELRELEQEHNLYEDVLDNFFNPSKNEEDLENESKEKKKAASISLKYVELTELPYPFDFEEMEQAEVKSFILESLQRYFSGERYFEEEPEG